MDEKNDREYKKVILGRIQDHRKLNNIRPPPGKIWIHCVSSGYGNGIAKVPEHQ